MRQALIWVNATGFLAGYYAMHNHWIQLSWFVLFLTAWLGTGGAAEFTEGLRRDRWFKAVCLLCFLMLVRSSLFETPGATIASLWLGWIKTPLLLAVLLMLWQAARSPDSIRRIGLPVVLVAAATSAISLPIFYLLHPEGLFGMRLRNCFVYGGFNSVCTGLTFGFAATWAACCWNKATDKRERRLWLLALIPLLIGTLLTLSRGALLALICGHLGVLLVCGWRRTWKPILLLVTAIGLFQGSGPLLSDMAVKLATPRLGTQSDAQTKAIVADNVVSANPVHAMVERSDNGRLLIYRAGLASMTTWQDWLVGKGLWSDNDFWSCSLYWYPEHLHSVFLDALVRGGVPGLLGLLVVLGWGLRQAVVLARRGEEIWLMLACFGIGGVLFDGDSAFSLLTLPRFEALILWTPLVMASARLSLATASTCSAPSLAPASEPLITSEAAIGTRQM